jgi:hypothetical protein
MLFTLFQNVSLLEEEVKNKIELSKKMKESKEGSDTDEDPDSEVEDDYLANHTEADLSCNYIHSKDIRHLKHHYSFSLISKNTPPPKISA